MAREMLEKIDRYRSPLAAALAILLTFFSRFGGKPCIPITNRQILEFGGESVNPDNRDQKRKIKTRLLNAIEEQRRWGWTPNYGEWPDRLRPDLGVSHADRILEGDGSEASPASLPRGYWEQLLDCKTGFSPPPDILAKNSHHVAESIRRTPGLVLENGNLEFKELYQRLQMQGLTQSQIAKKIEVSQSMVSRWCSGERKASKQSLNQLKSLLWQTRQER